MKKIMILLAFIAIVFAGCKKGESTGDSNTSNQQSSQQSSSSAQAQAAGGNVTLTEDIITRYIATFPEFAKIGMRIIARDSSRLSSVEAANIINEHVKKHGWSSVDEFNLVNTKISQSLGYITYKKNAAVMRNLPAENRAQMEQQYKEKMKDYSPEEIALIEKNSDKIYAAILGSVSGR